MESGCLAAEVVAQAFARGSDASASEPAVLPRVMKDALGGTTRSDGISRR